MSGGSRGQPDHQRSDDHNRPVVGRPLLIARCNAPLLLELVHAPLHHVAPAVGLAVELRRPTRRRWRWSLRSGIPCVMPRERSSSQQRGWL
jgi:hypothetical protein